MHGPGKGPVCVGILRVAEAGGLVAGGAKIGHGVERMTGRAETKAEERREAPERAEIDIGVGHEHRRLVVEVVDVEAAAATWTEVRIAANRLALRAAAIFAGNIEAEPATELIANTEREERRILQVELVDAPTFRPVEIAIGLGVIERLEALRADADVATQIPAEYSKPTPPRSARIGIGGGGA